MAKKIIKIDSQLLNAFQQCERLFYNGHILNLRANNESYSLERGQLCHDILHKYYDEYKVSRNRIASQIKGIEYGRAMVTHYGAIDIPHGMEILDNMREYFTYYTNERWLPIDTEQIHKKVIYEDDEIVVLYVAKIDVTVTGESQDIPLMPVDHKTYDRWFDPIELDNQFTGYTTILGTQWITINKIGFQKSYGPEKKFRRVKLGPYNDRKKEEWIHNTARTCKDMIFCLETNTFPMRRTQCGMYGGCRSLPICSADPLARSGIMEKLYHVVEPWNPEKAEAGD
jgi:hypothetical protein